MRAAAGERVLLHQPVAHAKWLRTFFYQLVAQVREVPVTDLSHEDRVRAGRLDRAARLFT